VFIALLARVHSFAEGFIVLLARVHSFAGQGFIRQNEALSGSIALLARVIDSEPYITYDTTQSENVILGLSSMMSSNHCQYGSSMAVYVCRIGFRKTLDDKIDLIDLNEMYRYYYDLKRPIRDVENYGEPSVNNEEGARWVHSFAEGFIALLKGSYNMRHSVGS